MIYRFHLLKPGLVKGGEHHCGRCGTCIERREAFHLAGVEDRTPYSDDAPTIEQMLETNWKLIEE